MTKIAKELVSVNRAGKGRASHVKGFNMEVEGLEELMQAFTDLGENAIFKLSGPSVEAANVVLEKARSKIHNVSGELDINLKVTKPGKNTSKKAYRIFAKVGFGQGAQHGVPLELGHKLVYFGEKTSLKVTPRPFLRPAADESKEEVVDIIAEAMSKAIEEMGGNK